MIRENKSILFKYLDINGAKKMLNNSNIQFTNAKRFNDPFDCHPSLIDFSNVPPERCQGWSPDIISLWESDRYRRYRENIWICCLSKLYDSILMWSYYNQHKGVCIGLDMEKVAKYLHTEYGMLVSPSGLEVQYRDIVEKPDYFQDKKNFFYYQIRMKAKAWEHEQEVRLFILNPSLCYMAIPDEFNNKNEMPNYNDLRVYTTIGGECFKEIYLGVNIDKNEKEEIIKLTQRLNPNIKVYQMKINPDLFKLDIIRTK